MVYRALADQFGDDYTVIHSAAWIHRSRGTHDRDGEADFVIVHPNRGILILEVKGGREISFDSARSSWRQVSRNGTEVRIKNPFHQARDSMYSIKDMLDGGVLAGRPAPNYVRGSRFPASEQMTPISDQTWSARCGWIRPTSTLPKKQFS